MTPPAMLAVAAPDTDEPADDQRAGAVTTSPGESYAFPATKGQERFWSLDQLNPGNPALNMPLMWRCTGPLDLNLLGEAFARVIERHESLRTTFDLVNGQLMQIIGVPWRMPISVIDLGSLGETEDSARAKQLINEHAAVRMNLRSGPLLLAKLLRFRTGNHLLLVTLHHSICDGVSTGILLRDVAAIYKALLEGTAAKVPELPLQFADYAIWQHEWRETPEYETSLGFWRRALGTNFARIELQHDRTGNEDTLSAKKAEAGDIETLLLDQHLAESVHDFCKKNSITYNVFFFSVFSIWLSRISGQLDLLIGSPSANRVLQTEDLVGMFMNIQATRVKIEEEDTFKALSNRVHEWTLQAYEHQQLPFEDLIYDQHFSSARGSFELPVFFLYQKSFMVTHQIGDLTIVPLRSMSPGAAFEIMFAVVDRVGEGPRLQLEFNPLKFRRETIKGYLSLYTDLVESALNDPSAPVSTLGGRYRPKDGASNFTAGAPDNARNRVVEQVPHEQRAYRDPIEFQLVEIWQSTLGIPYISLDEGFFSLGVSSLSALRLITKMNRIYSTDLGLSSLFSAPTIRAIAVLIRERLSPNMHSSLVPIQPLGRKRPLFVVHGIRGNVLSFYGLVTHLGKDQPVYGIQAQALVTGEPALLRFEDMARYYISEIRKVQPRGPYNLLGYSFGGMMVLEMAQQLRSAGQQVGLLGMLDSKSPDYMRALRKTRSVQEEGEPAARHTSAESNFAGPLDRFRELVEKVRTRFIRMSSQFAAMVGFRTLPAFMKDPWSVNFVADANYTPRVYDGRMSLFRAVRQSITDAPADLAWGRFFTGGVDVRELPGSHETLWSEENVGAFAASLAESLEETETGGLRQAS